MLCVCSAPFFFVLVFLNLTNEVFKWERCLFLYFFFLYFFLGDDFLIIRSVVICFGLVVMIHINGDG